MLETVDVAQFVELAEFERLAEARMPEPVRILVQGGAGTGSVIRANAAAWQRWALQPRALVDVSTRDTATTVLGHRIAAPIMVAPSGMQGLSHPEGEVAMARAARQADTLMVLSMSTSFAPEEVGVAAGPFWMQLYWGADRGFLREVVERAVAAGATALCLTVDLPVRPWLSSQMLWAWSQLAGQSAALTGNRLDDGRDDWNHDASLTWADLEWLQGISPLPLVLKGVMTAADAERAVEHGIAALIVSNHGGQALDYSLPTAEVLPEIVAAVDDRAEVLVDGGIRSGADVLRALALGARAVLVGRPPLWGLVLAGTDGAVRVMQVLREELDALMAITGARRIDDIERSMIRLRGEYAGR